MTDPNSPLTLAITAELEQSLAHALQFDSKKSFRASREYMAKLTASHFLDSLTWPGYVIMGRPAALPSHRSMVRSAFLHLTA